MNKILIFLCISTAILVLSLITICISPIINNIKVNVNGDEWSISKWRTLNCKIFADRENSENVELDHIQKLKKMKTLCNRKKAMHDLEFASLIINLVLGFLCSNLSLLHYLNVGKDFEKKTGMIGFITGIICFILTFVYVCFNGYIFNNDIAYAEVYDNNADPSNSNFFSGGIEKLFPNGASHKVVNSQYIRPNANEKDDDSLYVKYKDLGKKQYNYDSKLYKTYYGNGISDPCKSLDPSCEYIFQTPPETSVENKDLYDRWITVLILGIFIIACNIGLIIFGFLLFKSGGDSEEKTDAIV